MEEADRNEIKQIKYKVGDIATDVERITFELTRVEHERSRFDDDEDKRYIKNHGLFAILKEIKRSLQFIGWMLFVIVVMGVAMALR